MKKYKLEDKTVLLVLDGQNGQLLALTPDGELLGAIVEDCGGTPDGIAVDYKRQHIYWTNMGKHFDQNDGFIERVDFDGNNRVVIVKPGSTFTPKQLKIDEVNSLMYWSDREGMRVMRAALDGTGVLPLIVSGTTRQDRLDQTRHCVGIAIDIQNNHIYWTQKGPPDGGLGRIFRASLAPGANFNPVAREDIELLFDYLPEPIDLDIDYLTNELYWTDRGAPPDGNSVNRARVNHPMPFKYEIVVDSLQEAIGLSLDAANKRLFFCDLGGNIYCSLIGSSTKCHIYEGNYRFTGMVFYDPTTNIK